MQIEEESKLKTCAYIDGANLDKGTSELGWREVKNTTMFGCYI